ncbi:MAG: hypothetical protein ABW170_09375 [Candidatus Thiodiazotropha sp. L084R]
MYFAIITLVLSSYGCATVNNRLSDENAGRLLDSTYYVIIHHDQIVADHIKESKYEHKGGLIQGLVDSKNYKKMLGAIKPLSDRVGDLDFRNDFIDQLKKKLDFIDPSKIILVSTPINDEDDVLSLVESAPTDSVVLISAASKLEYGYRAYTVNVELSLWDKDITRPLYETLAYYNSHPVSFDHSGKYAERVLPIWISNNQKKYRDAYKEGLPESVNMVYKILSENNEYSKLEHYDTYDFYNYSTKTNVSGKILFSDNDYRKLAIDYYGNYHSVPTRKTYSSLSNKLDKVRSGNGRLFVYCPVDDCKLSNQATLIVDGRKAGYIYKEGFFIWI